MADGHWKKELKLELEILKEGLVGVGGGGRDPKKGGIDLTRG
jgi:hypothetical protein